MAGEKGKKRAFSYDSDEFEMEANTSTARTDKNNKTGGGSGGNDWAVWQEGVRTQEADRVQQYVKTFQNDIVQKAHDAALADLRRREEKRSQREKKIHGRILEECRLEARQDEENHHPLYIAGQQVLDLLEKTLEQYHKTDAALKSLDTAKGKEDFKRIRSSWDNDLTEAHKLLSYGRAYGDGLVRDIIVPADPKTPSPKADNGLNQTGKAALGMFPRSSTAVASRDTWGEAAQSQIDVLSRLMKTMSGGQHAERDYSVQAPEKKTVRFEI